MDKIKLLPEEYDRLVEAGWYTVQFQHFELNFYFKPSDVKRAVVISPGFFLRADQPHPYFQRIKMFADLEGIGISMADPSLDLAEDIQIGWFLGSRWVEYAQTIAGYLAGLFEHFGIPNDKAIFFGSSGGGFVSLVLSTYVRGAKALALNPQTDLLQFHDVGELARVLNAGWKGVSNMTIHREYKHRFSIAALWQLEQHVPAATILVNTYDAWHVEHHIAPLVAGTASVEMDAPGLQIKFYSDKALGHNPLPPSRLMPILQELNVQ